MKRELKPAEREEIVAAVAAGDRVKATSIYLSATEGNLTEAQNFIKALMEERVAALEAEEKARQGRLSPRDSLKRYNSEGFRERALKRKQARFR
jgi:hypothetical protein